MKKQTAVESLIEALLPFIDMSKTSDVALHLMIEEHMMMEKEQIMNDYHEGCQWGYEQQPYDCEQYYNETYNKQENEKEKKR